jgi:iron-sulfur cluster assembly protein
MLAVTTTAAEAIKGLSSAPGAEGVRISSTEPEDGVEPELQLELSTAPEPDDRVLEAAGAQIFLDPAAADMLDDKVLDADVAEGEVRFAVVEQGSVNQSRNGDGPDGPSTHG